MKRYIFSVVLLVAGMVTTNAHAGNEETRMILGSMIGGAIGAAIGHETGGREGAIVGSAIGAATGTALASRDRDREPRNQVVVVNHRHDDCRHNKNFRRDYNKHGHKHHKKHHKHHHHHDCDD